MARPLRIGLDAGHGFSNATPGRYDPGMDSVYIPDEHNMVHGMANRLCADLRKLGHYVVVTTDRPLAERDDIAKAHNVEMFVSLHLNASRDGKAHGCEVWCNTAYDYRARKVATKIRQRLKLMGFTDRGTKYTDKWAILRANKHDCLVEICFGDNALDVKTYQRNNAEDVEMALLNGILNGCGRGSIATPPRLK